MSWTGQRPLFMFGCRRAGFLLQSQTVAKQGMEFFNGFARAPLRLIDFLRVGDGKDTA